GPTGRFGRVLHRRMVPARDPPINHAPLCSRPGILAGMTEADGWREREAALRDPELAFETWRGLFDAVSEAIYVQDREGRFLALNRAVVAMYGYSVEELLGNTPELLAALDRVDLESIHD